MMANIARWDPMEDSLFDIFPAFFGTVARRAGDTWPRMDVAETQDAYHMSVELPGVKKESIQVSVYDDNVSINAENREEKTAGEEPNWLVKERTFGRISRMINLPEPVDETQAQAKHVDGVLYLTLPKKRSSAMKRLTIH
jgi:HSP20 family protein